MLCERKQSIMDDHYKYELTKLRGFSPQANYTDRTTNACRS
jgi:hypothetical protein